MTQLRGVGVRLSLALLLVVAAALGTVYVVVVPSLRTRLVDAKLSQLARAAPSVASQLPTNRFTWQDYVTVASASANARIIVYDVFSPPPTLSIYADSREVKSADVSDDAVALRALSALGHAGGIVTRGGERYAEAAVAGGPGGPVVLLTAPLHDSLANVALVRRRLLWSGFAALVGALALGIAGASHFARRIRRLERAADRIAGGDFGDTVHDPASDEVGELARAFERMRARLARLDHARGEFIANASHELRTPLFSLAGFLELLDDEELDEPTRLEFISTMRGQVDRLTKLATDLLDLSRLDAGRLRVDLQELDLNLLARTLVDEFRPRAAGRSLALVPRPDPAPALGDEQRVLQIGRILLENALTHTPAATGIEVRVDLRGEHALLAIADQGPGVPAAHAAHVFERFYRVDGPVASGSGLGLAIARELAELMGGSVLLEPGSWQVFTLRLPAGSSADAQPRGAGRLAAATS